jgi:hypothetical protein
VQVQHFSPSLKDLGGLHVFTGTDTFAFCHAMLMLSMQIASLHVRHKLLMVSFVQHIPECRKLPTHCVRPVHVCQGIITNARANQELTEPGLAPGLGVSPGVAGEPPSLLPAGERRFPPGDRGFPSAVGVPPGVRVDPGAGDAGDSPATAGDVEPAGVSSEFLAAVFACWQAAQRLHRCDLRPRGMQSAGRHGSRPRALAAASAASSG